MLNTDKELLELAAKAAGVEGEWVENSLLDDYYKLPTTGILMWSDGRRHIWNPITSSGDALRLAVKLRLLWDEMELFDLYFDSNANDSYTATRRAIVRAAAEIGKNI